MNKVFANICATTILIFSTTQAEDTLSWWAEKTRATAPETQLVSSSSAQITQIIPLSDFIKKVNTAQTILDEHMRNETRWLNGQRAQSLLTTPENSGSIDNFTDRFSSSARETLVQSLIVPANSELFVLGDLHGSMHSLVRTLQQLKNDGYINDNLTITKDNFYIILLGDFTDRGIYATEVIYLALSLLIQNPEKVIILRGNHDDKEMQQKDVGFLKELERKYSEGEIANISNAIWQLYSRLPVALYLGAGTADLTNFVQFSHGGIEPGFDPRPLFTFANHQPGLYYQAINCTDKIKRAEGIERSAMPQLGSGQEDTPCGFTLTDFAPPLLGRAGGTKVTSLRGYSFTTQDAIAWMEKLKDEVNHNYWNTIIRGHQHNPMLLARSERGTFAGCHVHDAEGMKRCTTIPLDVSGEKTIPLNSYAIYTLVSAPAIPGPNFAFDSFAFVKTAPQFTDWSIRLAEYPKPKEPSVAQSAGL